MPEAKRLPYVVNTKSDKFRYIEQRMDEREIIQDEDGNESYSLRNTGRVRVMSYLYNHTALESSGVVRAHRASPLFHTVKDAQGVAKLDDAGNPVLSQVDGVALVYAYTIDELRDDFDLGSIQEIDADASAETE